MFRLQPAIMMSCLCVSTLGGCANLQTRPGNPDSYNVGLSGTDYYGSDWKKLEWPTSFSTTQQGAQEQRTQVQSLREKAVPINEPPPAYLASNVPREIWQARGAAWNMHLKYLAGSYKAQNVQDALAVPIFGTAIATAALSIAKASTISIAATGLGGTAIYGGYSYLHPDKDMSADQTAAFALRCIVDQSLPLRTMSAIPLLLDKAALQDALDQLASDSPPGSPASTQQAVTAAQSAAKQTMTNLDVNISLYNNMPTLIYVTMDKIDQTAQSEAARTLDFNGILSSLQGAATNKQATASAQTAVSKAATTATSGVTKKGAVASPKLDSVTLPVSLGTTSDQTAPVSIYSAPLQISAADPSQILPSADKSKTGTNQITATSLKSTLQNINTTDLQKVINISSDANEDLAIIAYHAVAANIQSCEAGQAVTPITTDPSTAGSNSGTGG